jgi:photosystem II stability/assembly factor-like uncharacterized protein
MSLLKEAIHPRNPNRVYSGTFGDGLWKSDDGGQSWHRLKNVIFSNEVTSVSASRIEQENRVYVGTELMTEVNRGRE